MVEHLDYPVRDINLVLRACNPAEPLPSGDKRWYDFKGLRGGSVVEEMLRILSATPPEGAFHHRILCGHRGTGKSTELLRLMDRADGIGFLPVRVEVDIELGWIPLESYDLFLLTAMAVEKAMKDAGLPLPKKQVEQVVKWFAEVIKEEKETVRSELSLEAGAQLEAGIPLLGKLFGKFCSAVKTGSQEALTVRRRLRNFPETLVDLTNELLQFANKALKGHGHENGIWLLFDNLDRYEPKQIEHVLMRGATLVRRLACHALFTVPIEMEYAPQSGPTQDEYGLAFVLHMLALRRRADPWRATVAETDYNDDAVRIMGEALRQRLDVTALFEDPQDADLLVKMSGGCVRDLMHLVTLAFQHAGDKFTHSAVTAAIQQYRATFIRRLTRKDYERLARIAQRESVPRDELTARLLFHRFALEYAEERKPWMDVHPLIVEIEDFQRAIRGESPIVQG